MLRQFGITVLLIAQLMGIAYSETVCSIYDGDTFTLCNKQKVRIYGIDAPELKQAIGKQSRDYLATLVKDKDLKLTCKGTSYKRKVCIVLDGPNSIGAQMIRAGMAYESIQYSKGLYTFDEDTAKARRVGIWAGSYERPWDYRKRH